MIGNSRARGVIKVMKSQKARLFASILGLLCVAALYHTFFGNPAGPVTAKMRDYLTAHYSGESMPVGRGYYDEYVTRYAQDHTLSKRFAEQIGEMVFAIAKEEVSETTGVSAEIYVERGKYPRDAAYSTSMEEHCRLSIAFRGGRISEEEFVDKCVTVRDAVLARGFRVDYFGFDYRWGIKPEGFSLVLERDELYSTRESILAGGKVYRYESEPQKGGENWW